MICLCLLDAPSLGFINGGEKYNKIVLINYFGLVMCN